MNSILNLQGITEHIKKNKLSLNWVNFLFLFILHALFVIGLIFYSQRAFVFEQSAGWGPWIAGFCLYWLAGLGITMGYHRLWSHRTFKAHWMVEIFLSLISAMALQNSAIKWSSDHRKHHAYTDTEKDPYSASMGLLWSHFLWVLFDCPKAAGEKNQVPAEVGMGVGAGIEKSSERDRLRKEFPNVADLVQNPILRFQHRAYFVVGPFLTFVIPALLGLLLKDFWGYFLIAGIGRILLTYHSTFFINSLAHFWGDRPHSEKDTSRDSFLCAILALGEGYHNYHHTYPNDYRNGYRYYHFDPTKWIIKTLSWIDLTWDLKTVRPVGRRFVGQ